MHACNWSVLFFEAFVQMRIHVLELFCLGLGKSSISRHLNFFRGGNQGSSGSAVKSSSWSVSAF